MQTIIIYIHPSRQTSSIIHVHVIPDIFNYDISAKFITHKKKHPFKLPVYYSITYISKINVG